MLWMKHNVKQIAITYWVENCEQVLISSMNSNMDQSWRSSEKERFDGVCLTCGQVCFVCWEERWKKHLMHFIFLHEAPPPSPPHPYVKWINIWLACHNKDSNCTRPKNVCYQIFLYLGKTMAMFSCHFFEKLAQTYFCDGVISGGVSLPLPCYYWP